MSDGDEIFVPEAYREAAEHVRAHLVALRGGALFLSSADTLQLLDWFDRGVSVAAILCALECAAEARRKRRSRVPLGLRQARRHLKPAKQQLRVGVDQCKPLAALVGAARDQARREGEQALAALADALEALPDGEPEQVAEQALTRIARWLDEQWNALAGAERQRLLAAAVAGLGDLADLVDERTLGSLAEEAARDAIRARYPWSSTTAVFQLVAPEVPA